jgi:rhodanese-related sulfurtransferase
MNKKLFSCVLALGLMGSSIALAGEAEKAEKKEAPAKAPRFKTVTVANAASLQKEKKAILLDANSETVRQRDGFIPGAVMLTSFNKYDVAKELPAAKNSKLIFYCYNPQCLSSHEAAERAIDAGYTDVSILPDGIIGWKSAGQPAATTAPKS